jgi:hypothetical protein
LRSIFSGSIKKGELKNLKNRVQINKPIFVIGTGRSGSTIIFESLAVHHELAWMSNYNKLFPRLDIVSILPRLYNIQSFKKLPRGEKKQYTQGLSLINRLLPTPFECYPKWKLWCGEKFLFTFLKGVRATEEEIERTHKGISRILTWQRKHRFAAKVTGPTRIEFLNSIFPDAFFVHVKRDPRAVLFSWLEVDFWQKAGALNKPFWSGGLPEDWKHQWQSNGSTPLSLAAIQYRTIMQICEQEKKLISDGRYLEINYKDFVAEPLMSINKILNFCHLLPDRHVDEYVNSRKYKNQNKKYIDKITSDEHMVLKNIIGQDFNG